MRTIQACSRRHLGGDKGEGTWLASLPATISRHWVILAFHESLSREHYLSRGNISIHRSLLRSLESQVLKAKALEVRDALLESLVLKAREQNNDIISRYESILSRIAEKPTNEADLAALRVFIADSKEKVRCSTAKANKLPAVILLLMSVALDECLQHEVL